MNLKLIDRILTLGNLIGKAGLAYIETDLDFHVSSWNQGACDLFGYTENETMGKFVNNFIPISKIDLNDCNPAKFLTASQAHPDGQKVQCDFFYTSIMNVKGEKLGVAVLAKSIPISLEEKLILEQEKQHLSDIFSYSPIGIYQVNLEGQILSANPEYAWMLGYESSKAVTEQIHDFASQTFYDPEEAEAFMFNLYETQQAARFRCRLKKKDNSFIWVLNYAKATHDKSGRMNGFDGFSIDIGETVRAEQRIKIVNKELKKLSVVDGLTQISNRRRFDEYLESEWSRHYRDKKIISVILSDIDYFKLFNDNYGHQAGDDCLRKVAMAIDGCVKRSSDLAARYGGEEFAIILPDTDAKGAMVMAEKIRKSVLDLEITHEKSKANKCVTLSLGVAAIIPGNDNYTLEDLVAGADEALYKAKEKGRNQSISQKRE